MLSKHYSLRYAVRVVNAIRKEFNQRIQEARYRVRLAYLEIQTRLPTSAHFEHGKMRLDEIFV